MKNLFICLLTGMIALALMANAASAQDGRETYTGTVLSYGTGLNARVSTNTFTLILNGTTPGSEVDRLVSVLQEGGQDRLLDAIRKNDLGSFSVGGRLGRTLNAVTVETVDGKKRIRALFERWIRFSEIRGGYRSRDYPFGYIELFIDPKTGRGEGSLIEAAQIRWKRNKETDQYVVEIENFGTFPARLMGVAERGRR